MASENPPALDNPDSKISFDDHLKVIMDSDFSSDDFLKLLYNAVRRSCRNYYGYSIQSDVDDIVQSIALSLIKDDYHGLHSFNNRSSPKTWLQTIANHETSRFYRGRRFAISLEDLPPNEQTYSPSQGDKLLYDEIARKLTMGQKKLLELMILGLKTSEIAERNGTDPNSVSKSKIRLRNKIIKLLKSKDGRA
jgi:RNA polymerase sigma factor (sigma-70 family)